MNSLVLIKQACVLINFILQLLMLPFTAISFKLLTGS